MKCSRCEHSVFDELDPEDLCDNCVVTEPRLYYSKAYLAVVEDRLRRTRETARVLIQRGIGHDINSNPTKGRSQINEAGRRITSLQASQRLIRSELLSRGEVEPTIDERLERAFPEARNREIVELDGLRYEHFWLLEGTDRRGNNIWGRAWTPLSDA